MKRLCLALFAFIAVISAFSVEGDGQQGKRTIQLQQVQLAQVERDEYAGPFRSTNTYEIEPGTLKEIRITPSPPDGYELALQRWAVYHEKADYRQYENGHVFVITGPSGYTFQARWFATYVNWETKAFDGEERVYTIKVRGSPKDPDPDDPDDPDPDDPDDPPSHIDQVTYVYDLSQPIPRAIQAAIRQLNQAGILATQIRKDLRDEDGQIPDQYKQTLSVVNRVPSLVVQGNGKVIAVKENPTAEDVLKWK